MIRDLNAGSFRNVRFYTDWEARSQNIRADRVVELNFTNIYIGQQERATYRGDQRALTPEDWRLINNRSDDRPPGRNQIADRLIRNCYNLLLNRIQSGVSF